MHLFAECKKLDVSEHCLGFFVELYLPSRSPFCAQLGHVVAQCAEDNALSFLDDQLPVLFPPSAQRPTNITIRWYATKWEQQYPSSNTKILTHLPLCPICQICFRGRVHLLIEKFFKY
eukprot:TRINITY_DN813_c1_g1_i1.p1 TRINITY_DN813_c1_g1~~TRINITY_DN813_c1_g1_i1.p1  ORF type:complete len:118 (-),score=19.07 TRINITY_DN813_c1_g1_i1:254-607(-)